MKPNIICLLACLSLSMTACGEKETAQAPAMPPPAVSVIETRAQDVPLSQDFVGETHGLKDIAIRTRVEGFLEGVHFREGGKVKKGDLLYTVESQSYEEKVAARQSAVAEQETMLAKAKGDLDRIKPLARINAVSKSDLDEAVAAYEAGLSSVEAAKANLRAAQIELGYTKIHSPIDGIIGKTQAKVGDFVGRDPNPVILNTVSQVDTILVSFFITEIQYLEVARSPFRPVRVRRTFGTEGLRNGTDLNRRIRPTTIPARWILSTARWTPTTGAMLVQASFPNPDETAATRSVCQSTDPSGQVVKDGILIPQRCVMELQGLFNVFRHKMATTRWKPGKITVGPRIGSSWLITEGLKPGEQSGL